MTMTTLRGLKALEWAELTGCTLDQYATEIEPDGREGLTLEQAREVAREDTSLLYCEADSDDVEVEALSIKVTEVDGEAPDMWLRARIGGQEYRLFVARPVDGRPGYEACGDSLDDWCPMELRTRFDDELAAALGKEAIALAEAK